MCLRMDFKKLASDANTFFTRAVQFTEEKLGQVDRTEYDVQLENLLLKADKTKLYTEQIVGQTETILQPNPSVRLEDFLYEKVQGKKFQDRLVEEDLLGQHMVDAGNDFGSATPYGSLLIQCGHGQQKLGQSRRDFIQAAANDFLQPLRSFLDGDMKTIQKERRVLDTKRLDLDAAKSRLRRAKSQSAKETDPDLIGIAEAELRILQNDFDRHTEVMRLLLEGLSSSHEHHARCLQDFVEIQAKYYAQCHLSMVELQQQLSVASTNIPTVTTDGCNVATNIPNVTTDGYGEVKLSVISSADESNTLQLLAQEEDADVSGMIELSLANDEDAHIFDH